MGMGGLRCEMLIRKIKTERQCERSRGRWENCIQIYPDQVRLKCVGPSNSLQVAISMGPLSEE